MSDASIKGPLIGVRHVQIGLLFICILVTYFSKLNVAISLIAMREEFEWSSLQTSYILSSFFWGNILTQFLAGYLCRCFGVKIVLLIGTFVYSLLVLLTPVCIYWGEWKAFIGIRALMGVFQGFMVPSVQQHLANWSPKEERTCLGALTYTAFDCGSICAMFGTGLIASSSWGWPGVSYVGGSLGLAWCLIWLIFAANNPKQSKCIGELEQAYIMKSQAATDTVKIPIPWRGIINSHPFLALLVARCCGIWGLVVLQSEMPSYLNEVLQLNIKQNGLYSALPYLGMWLTSYVFIVLADWILGRQCLTLTQLRKTFNTIAFSMPAISLVGMSFLSAEYTIWAIVLITLGESAYSGSAIGSALNSIDLSPNHAGILTGIINTLCALVAIIVPFLVGAIVTDSDDRSQWQIIFGITALIYICGSLIYIKWGSAETQPWNESDYLKPKFMDVKTRVKVLDN